MRYEWLAITAVVCALTSVSASAPTSSASPQVMPAAPVEHVNLEGEDYVIVAPEHFCTSSLVGEAVRGQLEAVIGASVNAIWVGCDFVPTQPKTLVFGFVAVKPTPVDTKTSRAAVLKQMSALMQTSQGAALIHQGVEEGKSRASDAGVPTPTISSEPRLVGVDDNALYFIASGGAPSALGTKGVFIVEAITFVKGRLVLLSFGQVDPSADAQSDLVNKAKAEARRIVAANEALPA